MTLETQMKPRFIFSVGEPEDSMSMWLLFANRRIPSDFEIQVSDYVGTFANPKMAINHYNKVIDVLGQRPPAIIAVYDGNDLEIKYKSDKLRDEEKEEFYDGWY